ncbi:hypothetical protein UFOVP607_23 [uncultured Caudovirales phage]|uniref:Uncharacterized protein n=1 Tax=uncultured Caudovirales phage TaxID=2100421 RepID=A0A6J5MZC5_9CAUD|nr:hypothetical protein UFOVP607_23 [uncultured Caudovirales phage]
MNDEQLIKWAITDHAKSAAELGRMYKLSDARISNWVRAKKLPSGWREYFSAQYDKTAGVKP